MKTDRLKPSSAKRARRTAVRVFVKSIKTRARQAEKLTERARAIMNGRKRQTKPNGAVFYRGKSLITGRPIVGIITGLRKGSTNSKTGAMLQTWILCADVNPVVALQNGRDEDICGTCIHRPVKVPTGVNLKKHEQKRKKGSCYVTVVQAPNAVYKTFKRGRYPDLDLSQIAGRIVRIGSYGDPAAIPSHVWRDLLSHGAPTWTGYTHAWQTCDQSLRDIIMASVDTPEQRDLAIARGWRTFRVRRDLSPLDPKVEISCPASAEMNHRVTCNDCTLCEGTAIGARNIAILPHGSYAGAIIPVATLRAALQNGTPKPMMVTVTRTVPPAETARFDALQAFHSLIGGR